MLCTVRTANKFKDRNLTPLEYRYATAAMKIMKMSSSGILRSSSSRCRLVIALLMVVCMDVLLALSSANDRTTVAATLTAEVVKGNNVRLPGLSTRFNQFAEYCLHSQQSIARDLNRIDGRSTVILHPWERFQDVDRREHLEG